MRIDEVIQQPGQKERALKNDILRTLHVAVPGEIVSYYPSNRTATIQPVIREWDSTDPPPLLTDVPVFMWGSYTFTPKKGDGCLVVCADSCIDSWVQSGGINSPVVSRTHSLSDGFAFCGFCQGEWKDIDELLSVVTKTHDGLCPILPNDNDNTKFLRQDGSWVLPNYTQVSDSLDDESTTKALSAGKGKELNNKLIPKVLWANNAGTSSGEIEMNESIQNFYFLLLKYRTNAQEISQLVSTDLSYEIFQNVSLFNGSGLVSDYSYKSSCGITFTTNKKATVVTAYNNVNLVLRVHTIYGVLRK